MPSESSSLRHAAGRAVHRRRQARRPGRRAWHAAALRVHPRSGHPAAGGTDDEGQAEERCDVEFDGDPLTIGFNPTFLLDGLAAVHTERARMDFTTALKPAVLSGVDEPSGDEAAAGRRAGRQLPLPDHAGAPARVSRPSRVAIARDPHETRTRERLREGADVQLGLIGLGKMGGNMAERVRRAGHEVVGLRPRAGRGTSTAWRPGRRARGARGSSG